MYQELKKRLNDVCSSDDLKRWLEECDTLLQSIEDNFKAVRKLKEIIGGEYGESSSSNSNINNNNQEEKRVFWVDIDAAFKNRITSGMVLNVTHILPQECLADSFSLIAKQINTYIERFSTIKENTEFYAEFIKHDNTTEIKSFNTKTCAIDATICLEEWCLNYFGTNEALLTHETYCANINKTRIILPDEDNESEKWMMFKNHKNREPVPIVVYADLECLLSRNSGDEGKKCAETNEEDREKDEDYDDDDDDDDDDE
ncbi:hypothetical protein KPH14_000986 [Odynerus spinipes]|uniref:Uncharacterized protein n=1 Tax=Odynerus spinipes TaxID=1348599 RepID=A0AAD9REY1_9HYME|nr:hypothetical protein KPH14_000986 [Odynerus spinipes]